MANDTKHVPVLYEEVLSLLQPRAGGRYIDGTLGAGGHTGGLLEASSPDGQVLAFDRDAQALAYAQQRLEDYGSRVTFVNASFAEMGRVAPARGFAQVDGVLLDLGLSSRQLADSARGFSFLYEGPLDMRMDARQTTTAADLVNNLPESELANILWRYGDEQRSRRIARKIVDERPFTTTTELAEAIAESVGRRGRIHPATKSFQALRIAVNDELGALEKGLDAAIGLLAEGGRLAIISFHSLEDRMVKHRFRELSRDCVCPPEQPICTCDAQAMVRLVTRKAVKPTAEEIEANPRSRSARLRVAEKLAVSQQ